MALAGFVKCRDCDKYCEVHPFKKGDGFFTKKHTGENGCQCGTDQRRGAARQSWIKSNMNAEKGACKPKEKIVAPEKPKSEKQPEKKKSKVSLLWFLLIPAAGLGWVFSRSIGGKK